jgi:glycine/D-amino acid oxidase-like deaminating enzyme/nitrite reductase/ring-hydroxylating ferredoxin subunit
MMHTKDDTVSIWQKIPIHSFPSLETHLNTDVCVVGSGIAGVSTAYELVKSGLSVVVIDDGDIGGRQTFRTTAHLSNAFDDRYAEVIKKHGVHAARAVAESHTAAIRRVRAISRAEGIDCDFKNLSGYLFLDPAHDTHLLEKEKQACMQAGLTDVELLSSVGGIGFDLGPCLRFPAQGQIHPGKYMQGMIDRLKSLGVEFYSHTRAVQILRKPDLCVVTQNEVKIFANSVVVATNTPFNTLMRFHTKQHAYRSYVSVYALPKGSFPNALFWDTSDPYHYVRKKESTENDYLIVGGEDHKTGQQPGSDPHAKLDQWTRMRFPMVGGRVTHWSGQIMEPVDYLAYIGSMGGKWKNVYVITGDSGNGMTHGPLAGMIIRDQITHRENSWSKVYSPNRMSLRSLPSYVEENFNTALQYGDWISPGEAKALASIPTGSGMILREGAAKIAAYRDPKGYLHFKSAVCTHLDGIVHWNDFEKTWDCPCHGSRFTGTGEVINGPAFKDLKDAGVAVPAEEAPEGAEPVRQLPPPLAS